MRRRGTSLALLLAGALLAAACSRTDRGPAATISELRAPASSVPAEETGVGALRSAGEVLHAGARRIVVYRDGRTLEYRERVTSDGAGRFSLEPIEALSAVPADWRLLQFARQGFLFRYRDFEVRDAAQFAANWRLIDTGEEASVAGRACHRLRVERRGGPEHVFLLSVDDGTGLVLAYEELGPARAPIASMTYEAVELDPDLSGAIWFEPRFEKRPLDPLADARELGVPLPRRLPAGYALLEADELQADGQAWTRLTLTDGVDPLFYLYGAPDEAAQAGPEEILLYRIGAAGVAQARVSEGTFLAVGKVDEDDLADLVESALP